MSAPDRVAAIANTLWQRQAEAVGKKLKYTIAVNLGLHDVPLPLFEGDNHQQAAHAEHPKEPIQPYGLLQG